LALIIDHCTYRGVVRGGLLAPPSPREQRQKISVSCRSTEYGCDVVYIRKRLNISPIDRIIYYIYLFWKGSRGGGLGRTVGDCKQIGVGVGPAHQAPLRAISGYAPDCTTIGSVSNTPEVTKRQRQGHAKSSTKGRHVSGAPLSHQSNGGISHVVLYNRTTYISELLNDTLGTIHK